MRRLQIVGSRNDCFLGLALDASLRISNPHHNKNFVDLKNICYNCIGNSQGKEEMEVPSPGDIHEPHGNSYTGEHQQGCKGADKQRCGS
jgi:hypothetical protein